jgi:recombination protein RecT
MTNELTKNGDDKGIVTPSTVKGFMALPSTQKRVSDLLGERSSQFMTSVSSMIGADDKLAKCEPVSLFMACLTAAALDLPINKNLGFAHIIPYDNNRAGVTEAQFQMGYKGYIQLAKRTGQYKNIAVTEVYEGQLVAEDPLDGNTYDWAAKTSDRVVGYVAKFKELNGFEKEHYMSVEDVTEHAKKFSKAYQYDLKPTTKYKNSPWSTNFDKMAKKTVLKLLLNQWATLSIEMQKAIAVDQAVIKDENKLNYIDGDSILEDEKATAEEQNAILAVNEVATTNTDTPVQPAAPKKSVKQMAEERGWTGKGKQASLVDDNDSQS